MESNAAFSDIPHDVFFSRFQGALNGAAAVDCVEHLHAQYAQKASFVKRGIGADGLAVRVRLFKALACHGKPWVSVDDAIVVIGVSAGGYAAQQRHGGGNLLAAEPADKVIGKILVPAVAAYADGASAEQRVAARHHGKTDLAGGDRAVCDDFGCVVAVKERHGGIAHGKAARGIAPPIVKA